MGIAFDVFVTYSDGEPCTGKGVEALFPGFWDGGSITEYTDESGHAKFETRSDHSQVTIYVGGENRGTYDIEDGSGLTIVL
jgi:hypothetical protein